MIKVKRDCPHCGEPMPIPAATATWECPCCSWMDSVISKLRGDKPFGKE